MTAERWWTANEIADYLRVHVQTVRRWLRTGRLTAQSFGGKTGYRVRDADLRAFLRTTGQHPDAAESEPDEQGVRWSHALTAPILTTKPADEEHEDVYQPSRRRSPDHLLEQLICLGLFNEFKYHEGFATFESLRINDGQRGLRVRMRDQETGEITEVDVFCVPVELVRA